MNPNFTHPHGHETELEKLGLAAAQSATGFWEKHGNTTLIAISVVCLIASPIVYYTRSHYFTEQSAWTQLFSAKDATEKGDLADRYPNSTAAAWGLLQAGELRLSNGLTQMFTNRESAVIEIKKGIDAFEKILNGPYKAPSAVRERAMFGLARGQEMLSEGDCSNAVKTYEALVKQYSDSPYKAVAEERAKTLSQDKMQAFYAWFGKQNPKPSPMGGPNDRGFDPHGSRPSGGRSTLPDLESGILGSGDGLIVPSAPGSNGSGGPSLTVPSLPGSASTGDEKKPTEKPEPTTKPEGDAKPDEKKPADKKPEEKKPEEPKPAEPKPAESKPGETKPTETKPADEKKPAEPKPADAGKTESPAKPESPAEKK